ncbi:MAG: DegT/DnrJ/EryC1/StrS family aminotransferase [Gammaproteobacteria bacterium]
MKIPFVDLKAQYLRYEKEFGGAIQSVIENTAFIGGKPVKAFEADYERAYGVKHCVSVANGTDAIYIALKMLGVGPGDEVITVANSWISTSETIGQTGATTVFVDVDDYFGLDVSQIESRITERTRAIIPVHLFGQPADVDAVEALCKKHKLHMIEDCAQAHLAECNGRRVGTIGNAGTFSFYPGKNLGAYGDAGALITNDDELAERCTMFARHGALVKHAHQMEGINSRLDGIQAALLSAKLPHLPTWTQERQAVAAHYDKALAGIDDLTLPQIRPGCTHVYHLYVVLTDQRNELRQYLSDHDVSTGIHYPTPLPLLPAYAQQGHSAADFPRAASNSKRMLSLPIFPEMTPDMVERVAELIGQFFSR